MSEMVAFHQELVKPAKESVLSYMTETLGHVTALEPSLHLLPWSGVNDAAYKVQFAQCYDAGLRAAQGPAQAMEGDIPSNSEWEQGIGLLCFTAGYMSMHEPRLTHNRLCDCAKQLSAGLPLLADEPASGFTMVRSIALPVFRRLQRDGHSSRIVLLQTLLHLVAWKSASGYARQQAQRMLWMGGILGDDGEQHLLALDKALREERCGEEHLPALLIFTDFLANFPAGPIFVD